MAVQFVEERGSFGSRLGERLREGHEKGKSKGFLETITEIDEKKNLEKKEKILRDQENEAIKKELKVDLSGIIDPKQRQEMVTQALKGKYEKQKNFADEFRDKAAYETVKQNFGETAANLWEAAPIGGKTELLKHFMDSVARGEDLDKQLQGVKPPPKTEQNEEPVKPPQMVKGQIPKDYDWPDYTQRPQGYTAKEWVDTRKEWVKTNTPIFLENNTKLKNSINDERAIKKLEKLSDKLPEGFEKLIIDTETGDLRPIAKILELGSPEAEEWVKEISRFQNRAKDAFGSRVTNFDLMSFMKQFPSMLNTKEGRHRILKMMDINNKLDQLYERSLQKVYQKYGMSNIPFEEADRLATAFIEDETAKLNDEYIGLEIESEKSQLSGKMVDVIGPDGQMYEVDQSQVGELPEGYKVQ